MSEKGSLFPLEIVNAMECLAVNTRQQILAALLNKQEMSYTEIEKIGFTHGNLNHHLPIMIKSGLIERHIKENSREPFDSFYSITQFGRDFVNGIFQAMKPISKKMTIPIQGTSDLSWYVSGIVGHGIKGQIKSSVLTSSGLVQEIM